MNTTILKEAATAFAALDLSAENTRVTEIEADIVLKQDAIAAAQVRCTAIDRIVAEWRGPDARAVADALLDQIDPHLAAKAGPDIDDLKAERAALLSAIGDLRRRIESFHKEISDLRQAAFEALAPVSRPLVEALFVDAREAAQSMALTYAALFAVNQVTRSGAVELAKMRAAVTSVAGFQKLIPGDRQIAVPSGIGDVLRNLEGKGPLLPGRSPAAVPVPGP